MKHAQGILDNIALHQVWRQDSTSVSPRWLARAGGALTASGGRRAPGVTRGPGVLRARLRERPSELPHRTHIGPKDPPPRLHCFPFPVIVRRTGRQLLQGVRHRDLSPRGIRSVEPEWRRSTPGH